MLTTYICGAYQDTSAQRTACATLKNGDGAFFFSYSGMTDLILDLAKLAKQLGVFTIGVTSYREDNQLAKIVNLVFYVSTYSAQNIPLAYTNTRIAMLNILDVLYT